MAALVALAVALPLAALAAMSARARRVRAVLGLPAPRRLAAAPAVVATCALAALLAVAAAQPVVAAPQPTFVRSDVEALFVVDTSRSMLARPRAGAPARIDRARVLARRLRREIPDVRVGLASLTDRLLPHAFPTADPDVFRAALERSVGVGRPPPQELRRHATIFTPLESVVTGNLFRAGIARRALVVLTDGEARELGTVGELRAALRPARPLAILFVRVRAPDERVFRRDGRPEAAYRADPTTGRALAEFTATLGAELFAEREADAAAAALRRAVGTGPRQAAGEREQPRSLASHAAAAALLPLLFLLWTRNRA
ncbi:MAG: VWA domain-containing protein [Thermoleophilia bacterium]|nr:VWA domain-containing protein [Thermoleophilia bacterium]